jgi:hypothetical protein
VAGKKLTINLKDGTGVMEGRVSTLRARRQLMAVVPAPN